MNKTVIIGSLFAVFPLLSTVQEKDVVPLMEQFRSAMIYGDIARAKNIFDKGLTIELLNRAYYCKDGEMPLRYAMRHNLGNFAGLLIDAGASIRDGQDLSLFGYAIYHNNIELVKKFLAKCMYIEEPVLYSGLTPLTWAIIHGKIAVAKLLVEMGAYVNARNSSDDTVLMRATLQPEIMPLLLSKGADEDAESKPGVTVLSMAVNYEMAQSVLLLLKAGADPNKGLWKKPLHVAVEKNDINLINLLLEYKANVSAEDQFGETPLQLARKKGHAKAIEILQKAEEAALKAKADEEARNAQEIAKKASNEATQKIHEEEIKADKTTAKMSLFDFVAALRASKSKKTE